MKLMLKITGGIILAVIVLMAGCAALLGSAANEATKKQSWTVAVTAPDSKCWSGAFGSSSVDGCGSKSVAIKDLSITSANAQKQDGGAWTLGLKLTNAKGEIKDSSSTRAAYGVTSVTGIN